MTIYSCWQPLRNIPPKVLQALLDAQDLTTQRLITRCIRYEAAAPYASEVAPADKDAELLVKPPGLPPKDWSETLKPQRKPNNCDQAKELVQLAIDHYMQWIDQEIPKLLKAQFPEPEAFGSVRSLDDTAMVTVKQASSFDECSSYTCESFSDFIDDDSIYEPSTDVSSECSGVMVEINSNVLFKQCFGVRPSELDSSESEEGEVSI
ncbi:hypothetical protein WJX73_009880 [Symbiochloris irregularis]|uniref:Uncharacterized protein n=1 Tax=Symbiochloris irregularis TaxID=706552 RepID=A0AAW1NRD7_9CHLO